jgi:hypothetical protein
MEFHVLSKDNYCVLALNWLFTEHSWGPSRCMPAVPGNVWNTPTCWNSIVCKTTSCMWLANFQNTHWPVNCMCLSKFHSCIILSQNYAGNKLKSYEIMRIEILATLDKTKLSTGIIRDLNWAALEHTTVQVTKLPLQLELSKIRHDQLYKAWTGRDIVCVVYCWMCLTL